MIKKLDIVKIISIGVDGLGNIIGLGNNQKIYIWCDGSKYQGWYENI
jgi:hypothetical protein